LCRVKCIFNDALENQWEMQIVCGFSSPFWKPQSVREKQESRRVAEAFSAKQPDIA